MKQVEGRKGKMAIIFLDVDGTLVNYKGQLPSSAEQAIRQAQEKGHRVVMCTGRSRAEIPDQLWNIGLDGLIGGNGNYVEYHQKVLYHQTLTLEQCTRVVDWLHERQLEFYLESNNGLFASEQFREKSQPVMREYSKRKGKELEGEYVMHGMVFGGELYRADVNKISFILSSYQDHLDSKAAFPDLVANTWGGADQTALFGDLGVKDIDKAVAIRVLLDELNASIEDTIAFGDATIDIPMLQQCHIGVAMGNASEEVKRIADYVTSSVDEDGLWNAFQQLHLLDTPNENTKQ